MSDTSDFIRNEADALEAIGGKSGAEALRIVAATLDHLVTCRNLDLHERVIRFAAELESVREAQQVGRKKQNV